MTKRWSATVAAALLVATTTGQARAQSASVPTGGDIDVPVRPERNESSEKPPSTIRRSLLIGGIGFTAGFWALNAGTSALFPDEPGFKYLRAPLVGPWLALGHNSCSGTCEFPHYFNIAYFVFSGIAQASGLGLVLESFLTPTRAPGAAPLVRTVRPPAPSADDPNTAPGPAAPPPSTPTERRPSGPLFYLPMPVTIGQGGAGVMWGGIF